MPVPTDITAGTLTITNGSTAVIGAGTSWLASDLRQGDLILWIEGGDGFWQPILQSVESNTALTLAEPWEGPTLAAARYRIRYQWDSSRVSAQSRQLIELLDNGNLLAFSGLTGPGVPVFNGPHSIVIKPETDFINGIAFNVQVDTLADRAAYDGQSTGFTVLVSDVGDGRSAVYSKNSNTSADWSDPAYITGPAGPAPVIDAEITQTAPGTLPDVITTPISGGYELEFQLPLVRGSGFQFEFATATADANPGAGNWRANNAAFGSATQLFISKTSDVGADVAAFLLAMNTSTSPNKGALVFQRLSDGVTASWVVTGVTDATGYVKVAVSSYSGPSVFTAADLSMLQFMKSGNAGAGTGDVVGPASSTANRYARYADATGKLLIDGPNGIPNADLANVATATLKGRRTAGTGAPEDLTVAQAITLLGLERICFSASKGGTDQTGFGNSKVTFTSEVFDIGGYYDAPNSRFLPPAGRYRLSARILVAGTITDGSFYTISIYKNGNQWAANQLRAASATGFSVDITEIVESNGTDYWEIFFNSGSGGTTANGQFIYTAFGGEAV